MFKYSKRRVIGLACGLAVLALVFAASLTLASRTAEAGCYTDSVCTYRYGRSVCSTSTRCAPPRVPACRLVTRCYPQRSCHSSYGTTTCVTRDVCRAEQVCW